METDTSNDHEEGYGEGYEETSYISGNDEALFAAAREGDLNKVLLAIQDGADPNCWDEFAGRHQAIHLAAYYGHSEVVKTLLKSGAEIDSIGNFAISNEESKYGTPLHLAVETGNLELAKFLIESGANFNLTDGTYEYYTPLHTACRSGKLDAVKLLKDKAADMEAVDGAGETAINIASDYGHLPVVKYLLENGANVNSTSMIHTPLLAAAENGHLEVVKFLLTKGATVNATGQYRKDTPLHVAAQNGFPDVCSFLLKNGADRKAVNDEGKTALDLASTPQVKTALQ
jgi:ankyrin repeat protein